MTDGDHRPLTAAEIQTLAAQGCAAADWNRVRVTGGFDPTAVRNTHFLGEVRLGANGGRVNDAGSVVNVHDAASVVADGAVEKPCGIYNALLSNCTVGDNVRIANVGQQLANYDIGAGACIENVGRLETRPGATFGNGIEVEVLNEGGGREVVLFDRLDSQFAHLLCLHRYRAGLVERLLAVAKAEAAKAASPRGRIGAVTRIANVGSIVDVNVGSYAVIDGAALLARGTILSTEQAPTQIGSGVQAEDFIIAEGSKVTGGAIIAKSFLGQGCQIGKQFSSEGSLFFANCEGFHGEACSVFAGPYTVTHHKSTLLIAGLFSFYNAGSGTNQSNHLYKLGPVHEGKLERGCKTGSFSYLMWPCRVGPFSVVRGKHGRNFDTADFPFSYLEALPNGRCLMTPGFNFTTVGTVRDGAKWPARDRRRGAVRRDRITFDVFSPLTVGRMLTGSERMKELFDKTERDIETVTISGVDVKRILLRTGQKTYRSAIEMYLLDKVLARVERARDGSIALAEALKPSTEAVYDPDWIDVGGQMMPRRRLDDLCAAIVGGDIYDFDGISNRLDAILAAYAEDEWIWVYQTYPRVFGRSLDTLAGDDLLGIGDEWLKARKKFLNLVLNDAQKEFDNVIRTGFGQDGTEADAAADFVGVRGEFDSNRFVKEVQREIASLPGRVEKWKQAVASRS